MLFKNYGLFWRQESVFWGRGSNKGHLKGVLASARTAEAIDFRNQQGVYVLYDDSFQIVYIGQAGSGENQRLFSRLKRHRKDALAERWERFSWFGVREVLMSGRLKAEKMRVAPSIGDVLNHVEAVLIAAAEPTHNRQGGRFGDNVEQYLQFRDQENLGLEPDEMLRELWNAHNIRKD